MDYIDKYNITFPIILLKKLSFIYTYFLNFDKNKSLKGDMVWYQVKLDVTIKYNTKVYIDSCSLPYLPMSHTL